MDYRIFVSKLHPNNSSSLFHQISTHGYVKLCIQGEIRSIQCNKYNQTGVNIKETDDECTLLFISLVKKKSNIMMMQNSDTKTTVKTVIPTYDI